MFLDDMLMENWGAVGVAEKPSLDNVKMYNKNRQLAVEAGLDWDEGVLTVYTLTGQKIFQSRYKGNRLVQIGRKNGNLFLVNLRKGANSITKKVMIP